MQFSRTAAWLAVLIGCGSALAAEVPPPGASSCSGCHPAGGVETPVLRLVGRSAAEIVTAMQDFRSGQRPATVMDRIAKGFSDDDVRRIAAWYAAQKE